MLSVNLPFELGKQTEKLTQKIIAASIADFAGCPIMYNNINTFHHSDISSLNVSIISFFKQSIGKASDYDSLEEYEEKFTEILHQIGCKFQEAFRIPGVYDNLSSTMRYLTNCRRFTT